MVLLAVAAVATGCARGYRGVVYERLVGGGIGPVIPGVAIEFATSDRGLVRLTTSDAAGRYRVSLPSGRYLASARTVGFEDYASAPGFFVVPTGSGMNTGNFFLRQPRTTVALVVRHADRDPAGGDFLTAAGLARAVELAEVASRAGVSAVYSTDTVRTRSTAAPLAEQLGLTIQIYASSAELATRIADDHAGDTVLIVGHSNTTTELAEALVDENLYPGAENPHTEDFDNLFVVSRPVAGGAGSVLNLQYGAGSTPDTPDLGRARATHLHLVRAAEASGAVLTAAGQARAAALAGVAAKAEVSALFAPAGSAAAATLAPLATASGLAVESYDGADPAALVERILEDFANQSVVVAGESTVLRAIAVELGAAPFPIFLGAELDQLVVAIAAAPGEARVVALQFGAPSP